MNETNPQDPLATALAREAVEMTPAFSPTLHTRIMRRINTASAIQDEGSKFRIHRLAFGRLAFGRLAFGRLAIGAAVAAMLVVSVSVMFTGQHPPKPMHKEIARLPSMPPIENPVETFSKPVGNSLTEARYAYLDRDARNVMHYIADQVDVLPATH